MLLNYVLWDYHRIHFEKPQITHPHTRKQSAICLCPYLEKNAESPAFQACSWLESLRASRHTQTRACRPQQRVATRGHSSRQFQSGCSMQEPEAQSYNTVAGRISGYLSVFGALNTHSNSIEKKSRGGFSPDGRYLSAVTFCEAQQPRQVRRAPFQGLGAGVSAGFSVGFSSAANGLSSCSSMISAANGDKPL